MKKQLVNEGKKPIALNWVFQYILLDTNLYAYETVSVLSLTPKHCDTAVIYRMMSSEIIIYEERNVANLLFRKKP